MTELQIARFHLKDCQRLIHFARKGGIYSWRLELEFYRALDWVWIAQIEDAVAKEIAEMPRRLDQLEQWYLEHS